MNLSPIDRLKRARINLLMDEPFFGSLLMQLKIIERRNIPTFRTDGAQLQFNPAYLDKLDDTQLRTVLAHEVMHCALLHPFRVGHRTLKLANRATDYAVNNFLDHYNQQTPGTPPFKWAQDDAGKPDVLIDHAYDNMSFEGIYAALDRKNPLNS